jgi:hypothetical protein
MAATADAGLDSLRRFIANLTAASNALPKVDELVAATGRGFDEIEKEAGTEGDGLNSHLDQVTSALEGGQKDVRDGLAELAQAATVVQSALGEAQTKVEEAAADLEARTQKALGELDTAHAALTDQGFKALDQALEALDRQIDTEKQEAQQAFNEMETTIKAFETEAQVSWDGAETALDQAAGDLLEEESGLEETVSEGTQGLQASGLEQEGNCNALEGEIVGLYETFGSSVEGQGQEWDQTVSQAVRDAIAFVETGQQERLDQPASLVHDEALTVLAQEYAALGTVLDAAVQIAGELEPLASDLQRCEEVCDVIGRLLGALAG